MPTIHIPAKAVKKQKELTDPLVDMTVTDWIRDLIIKYQHLDGARKKFLAALGVKNENRSKVQNRKRPIRKRNNLR